MGRCARPAATSAAEHEGDHAAGVDEVPHNVVGAALDLHSPNENAHRVRALDDDSMVVPTSPPAEGTRPDELVSWREAILAERDRERLPRRRHKRAQSFGNSRDCVSSAESGCKAVLQLRQGECLAAWLHDGVNEALADTEDRMAMLAVHEEPAGKLIHNLRASSSAVPARFRALQLPQDHLEGGMEGHHTAQFARNNGSLLRAGVQPCVQQADDRRSSSVKVVPRPQRRDNVRDGQVAVAWREQRLDGRLQSSIAGRGVGECFGIGIQPRRPRLSRRWSTYLPRRSAGKFRKLHQHRPRRSPAAALPCWCRRRKAPAATRHVQQAKLGSGQRRRSACRARKQRSGTTSRQGRRGN